MFATKYNAASQNSPVRCPIDEHSPLFPETLAEGSEMDVSPMGLAVVAQFHINDVTAIGMSDIAGKAVADHLCTPVQLVSEERCRASQHCTGGGVTARYCWLPLIPKHLISIKQMED